MADWIDLVNHHNSEIRESQIEIYSKFLGIKEVLNRWEILKTNEALRNFVYFFYYNGHKFSPMDFALQMKYIKANL